MLSFRRTPVTALLLLAIGAGFLLEILAGGSNRGEVLVALGANYPPLVWQGQWWRLLTSVFLHGGILHLLLNGWALLQLGGLFETWARSWRMLAVFLVTGAAGSFASLFWTRGLSVGASGAIFGLLGALIAFLLRRRDMLTPFGKSVLSQLLMWAAINIFLGFSTPRIDNAAHLGGAFAGFLMGLALKGQELRPRAQVIEV